MIDTLSIFLGAMSWWFASWSVDYYRSRFYRKWLREKKQNKGKKDNNGK